MDAVKFIREWKRMCESTEYCGDCAGRAARGKDGTCMLRNVENPAKLAAADEEWSKEHLRKTRQNALLKAFPDASLDENGIIRVCPAEVSRECRDEKSGGCGNANLDCSKCRYDFWMQEVD